MITITSNAARSGLLGRFAVALIALFAALFLALPAQQAWAAPDENAASESSSASTAAAEPASTSSASSSNSEAAEEAAETLAVSTTDGLVIGGDVFLAQQELVSSSLAVPANLFAASQNIAFNLGEVGADAFIAATDVSLTGTKIDNNLFAAGNSLTLSGIDAANLFVSGRNLDIDATADNVFAAGDTVFLKGAYDGDVTIDASSVVVDPYLVVNGTLSITAQQEPTIASTAKIADYSFTEGQESSIANLSFSRIGTEPWLWDLGMLLLGMLIVGIIILIVLRTEVVDATGSILRQRPLAIFLTGIIAIVLVPIVSFLPLLVGVAWQVTLALCFGAVLVTFCAAIYTAIALGRVLLPKVNKWVTSIIFLVVFAALLMIPIANIIVYALSILVFAGSLIQGWWVWRRGKAELPPSGDLIDDFSVPRGTHAIPNVEANPAPVVPAASTPADTTGFAPRNWNE